MTSVSRSCYVVTRRLEKYHVLRVGTLRVLYTTEHRSDAEACAALFDRLDAHNQVLGRRIGRLAQQVLGFPARSLDEVIRSWFSLTGASHAAPILAGMLAVAAGFELGATLTLAQDTGSYNLALLACGVCAGVLSFKCAQVAQEV